MPFVITDSHTSASGRVNEDRAGAAHDLAWVIDGATDVVERPLTSAATAADWIAGRLDATLRELAVTPDLSQPPALTAARLATEFLARRSERRSTRPSILRLPPSSCGPALSASIMCRSETALYWLKARAVSSVLASMMPAILSSRKPWQPFMPNIAVSTLRPHEREFGHRSKPAGQL